MNDDEKNLSIHQKSTNCCSSTGCAMFGCERELFMIFHWQSIQTHQKFLQTSRVYRSVFYIFDPADVPMSMVSTLIITPTKDRVQFA